MKTTALDEHYRRLIALPRPQVARYARDYEARAEQVGERCRNNVSARLSLKLRMFLAGDSISYQNQKERLNQ